MFMAFLKHIVLGLEKGHFPLSYLIKKGKILQKEGMSMVLQQVDLEDVGG